MGLLQRKEREKEEMRRLILEAAKRLFQERGYRATSLRNIADAIEYSPATIYLYYKDKNAILFALQYEASALLRDHVLPTIPITDPWHRMIEFGRRYIDFGLKHSDLYDLLFIMRSPMEHMEDEECWQIGLATHNFFVEIIRECQAAGHFKERDPETVAYALWCHAHGMICLFIRNRMRMYPEEKRAELLRTSFALMEEMAQKI